MWILGVSVCVWKQRWTNLPLTTHFAEISPTDVIAWNGNRAQSKQFFILLPRWNEMTGAPGKKLSMRSTVTNWSNSHLNYDTCRCMNLLSRAIINISFSNHDYPCGKCTMKNGKAFISSVCWRVFVCAWLGIRCVYNSGNLRSQRPRSDESHNNAVSCYPCRAACVSDNINRMYLLCACTIPHRAWTCCREYRNWPANVDKENDGM